MQYRTRELYFTRGAVGAIASPAVINQPAATGPATPGPQVFRFVANDGLPDRYNDRISPKGWNLDAYNANGIVLYNHDDGGRTKSDVLPIGKGKAFVEGDRLMADIVFDDADPFAREVARKVEAGFLNAVSVRLRMLDARPNDLGGLDSDRHELLEISVVTIPANERAVRVKSADGDEVRQIIKEELAPVLDGLARLAAMAEDEGDPEAAPETPPEPAPDTEEAKKFQANADDLAKAIAAAFVDVFRGNPNGR